MSAARAYLKPARKRSNLTVVCEALVQRIVFEDQRAVAVEYEHNGASHCAYGAQQICLSAGAVNSPQLLQLSGIGPRKVLQQAGVEPVSYTHLTLPTICSV